MSQFEILVKGSLIISFRYPSLSDFAEHFSEVDRADERQVPSSLCLAQQEPRDLGLFFFIMGHV